MGKSLFDKVWEAHTVRTLPNGQTQLFIALHLIHEVTSPQAFGMIRQLGLSVPHPERTFATVDHIIPTDTHRRPFEDAMAEEMMVALKDNCERYGITLNRVPLADTVDAVNQVLSEKEAGVAAGAVDVIWINGENFLSLKQADMLLPDWSRRLPNAKLVDWDNPAIYLDFGEPVEGYESPWSSAQFQLIYDSARLSEEELASVAGGH